MTSRRHFVFLTQVYPPDPAAVGQHLADAAEELARRGHKVSVFTADRGFDDPSMRYVSRENRSGVQVRRLPFGSFGKSSILARVASGIVLMVQELVHGLAVPDLDTVVVTTSPPVGPMAGVVLSRLKGASLKYWVMDVNPDQMVALGKIKRDSVLARIFGWMNGIALKRASAVIVLDRMMATLIEKKADVADRLTVVRPWAADEPSQAVLHENNPFRTTLGAGDRLVVMYSGNHALSHPLTTIVEAAKRLNDVPRLLFAFVGGGVGKKEIDSATSPNIVSLPYQDRSMLQFSLAAADVHLVSIGESMSGIVHPSKIYGAMAVGKPILMLGAEESPMGDLLSRADIGWRVSHGDVDEAERVLRQIASTSCAELEAKGRRARALLDEIGTRQRSCAAVCDVLERTRHLAHEHPEVVTDLL